MWIIKTNKNASEAHPLPQLRLCLSHLFHNLVKHFREHEPKCNSTRYHKSFRCNGDSGAVVILHKASHGVIRETSWYEWNNPWYAKYNHRRFVYPCQHLADNGNNKGGDECSWDTVDFCPY